MASFVISSAANVWPVGTTVGAYLPAPSPVASGAPTTGAAIVTAAVASDGSVTFVGLQPDTAYVAWDGATRWTRFRTKKVAIANTGGLGGLIIPTDRGWGPGTSAFSTDTTKITRFSATRDMLIGGFAFVVTSLATNNDPIEGAIWDRTGTVKLASSAAAGQPGVNSTGRKIVNFLTPYTIREGETYYHSFSYDYASGTGATIAIATFNAQLIAALAGAGAGTTMAEQMTGAGNGVTPAALTFAATTPNTSAALLAELIEV